MAWCDRSEGDGVEIDARGHRCPTPTLRLRRALEAAPPGAMVTILADDPLARIDIPHFVAANGHALVSLTTDAGTVCARVRKGG
jgi:tRNA 2-thiouridine synthesizing protein A